MRGWPVRSVSLRRMLPLAALLVLLLAAYLPTLQTIPNGAEHYLMIDVGETQNVLNTWGTLHATGYPLYVMTGSALVSLLRATGISAATAPALVSLLWGLLALGIVFSLMSSLISRQLSVEKPSPPTPRPEGEGCKTLSDSALSPQPSVLGIRHYLPALLATLLLGLTRTVWVHLVIAEIYSFGLLLLILLLAVALWWPSPPLPQGERRSGLQYWFMSRRLYWLAFIGGIAVFHHRALLMAAPALLYAVWQDVVGTQKPSPPTPLSQGEGRKTHSDSALSPKNSKLGTRNSKLSSVLSTQYLARVSVRLTLCLLLGLLGFLPYIYLPLRANAGAAWVYGQPNSWTGFWDQFLGREAERFMGTPDSLAGLLANINTVNTVLFTDLTAPGLIAGLAGLLLALRQPALRRAAITLLLSGAAAYVFHIVFYTDILSALILPVLVSVAFGWAFLIAFALTSRPPLPQGEGEKARLSSPLFIRWGDLGTGNKFSRAAAVLVALLFAAYLYTQNQPFIYQLTHDETGLETIALVEGAPAGSTVMLAWGPRYFAARFAQDQQGRLPGIELVDHRADYVAVLARGGQLLTPEYTFYNQPLSWWETRLGAPVYLNAAAPYLVQIKTLPEFADRPPDGLGAVSRWVECLSDRLVVRVVWAAPRVPQRHLSVFVHLLDADDNLIAQGDQAAPVYGWRPVTTWLAGERVQDVYTLPRREDGVKVRFGLYYQADSGEFVNEVVYELPVECE